MHKPIPNAAITVPSPKGPPSSHPMRTADPPITVLEIPAARPVFLFTATMRLSLGPAPKPALI
ncbi:hypothetical protein MASR2M79_08590 [Aminivibrio sp.]